MQGVPRRERSGEEKDHPRGESPFLGELLSQKKRSRQPKSTNSRTTGESLSPAFLMTIIGERETL